MELTDRLEIADQGNMVVTWLTELFYNGPMTLAAVILFGLLLLASCGSTEVTPTFISPPEPITRTTVVEAATVTSSPELPTPTVAGSEEVTQIKQYSQYPAMIIDVDKEYTATFNTNQGQFTVELFAKDAPITVNSFVFLAQDGFYNGVIFHRVIAGFMSQAGDPTRTGSVGISYSFEDEFVPSLVFDGKGYLAMANPGFPDSNGSQFFITAAPTPHLNGFHTIFGEVSEGQEVVDAINAVATVDKVLYVPIEPVVIESIVIN